MRLACESGPAGSTAELAPLGVINTGLLLKRSSYHSLRSASTVKSESVPARISCCALTLLVHVECRCVLEELQVLLRQKSLPTVGGPEQTFQSMRDLLTISSSPLPPSSSASPFRP